MAASSSSDKGLRVEAPDFSSLVEALIGVGLVDVSLSPQLLRSEALEFVRELGDDAEAVVRALLFSDRKEYLFVAQVPSSARSVAS